MIDEIAIELKNISKSYKMNYNEKSTVFDVVTKSVNRKPPMKQFSALTDVSFKVKKGEVLGIVGHNGSGKSTLLKIISKIIEPTKGSISIEGKIVPFLNLGVGFHPDLTAKTNVIQYGILLGFSKKKITEMLPQIMEFAELEKFMDTTLKNFSSGMLARLAFSTAIQVDPDILLIDEILSVGDLSFQQKSFEAIMSFKKRGKSIILVTHDLNSVSQYCDRAMLLNKGIIEEIGDPQKVIEKYQKLS